MPIDTKVLKEIFLTDKTNKDKYIFWIQSKNSSNVCQQSRSDITFLGEYKYDRLNLYLCPAFYFLVCYLPNFRMKEKCVYNFR